MKYVFGPLQSRRLGNSLGINLLPYKICTFDCIYCQLGPTVEKTVKKIKFTDTQRLIDELKVALQDSHIDYVTFAGLGEPTLVTNLGELIEKIKKITILPVAVITNGSLLAEKQARASLLNADVVLPSLDAAEEKILSKINRPHTSLKLAKIINGLVSLRREFKGQIWLEIMLVKQIEVSSEHLKCFKSAIEKIKPDKVHLNSPVRIKDNYASPLDKKRLLEIKEFLGDNCFIV